MSYNLCVLYQNVRDTFSQIIFRICFLILYHKSRIEYLQIVYNRIMLFMDWKEAGCFYVCFGLSLTNFFFVLLFSLILYTLLLFRYTCMDDLHYNTVSVIAFYSEISDISLVFDQRLPIIRNAKNTTMNTNKKQNHFQGQTG